MSILEPILSKITHDIGIDLGTSSIKVALKGRGIVYNEPSVVAINKRTKQVLAVGVEARKMIGRTPSGIVAVRPLRDGVISDFDSTEAMVRYFINKVNNEFSHSFKIPRPRVVVGIPSSATEVEARAVVESARSAGARKVYVIEEPMSAAIGAGLPIEEPFGSMIVDIGGGTTDIAVIALGGIVIDNTIRVAGDEMDEEIVNYAKYKYNLQIGEKMAEDVKKEIGCAIPQRKEQKRILKGRDLLSGLPKTIEITNLEIMEALVKVLDRITENIKEAIEKTPPELLADMLDRGIVITGGGANLPGLDKYFSERLKLPVNIDPEPVNAVARGTEKLLDSISLLDRVEIDLENLI